MSVVYINHINAQFIVKTTKSILFFICVKSKLFFTQTRQNYDSIRFTSIVKNELTNAIYFALLNNDDTASISLARFTAALGSFVIKPACESQRELQKYSEAGNYTIRQRE